MGNYSGLKGVEGALNGEFCGSASQMLRRLGKSRVVSAAGDEGALTAWIDDAGIYRATFCRFMSAIAQTEASSKAQLLPFLNHWFPAMRDVHSLSAAMKESAQ